jgi:hypothetical protein
VSEDSGFTRFLRNLEPDQPLDQDDDREFEEVWTGLRRLLVSELKRRSLWSLPPACLGIYGCTTWADPEAVEELVADCFVFIFVERFRSLKAQLRYKPNVEGLIVRNVRNFLHETQRRHDPVGYRVFTVLRSAVRDALSAGELQVIAGSPRAPRPPADVIHTPWLRSGSKRLWPLTKSGLPEGSRWPTAFMTSASSLSGKRIGRRRLCTSTDPSRSAGCCNL